MAYYRRNYRRNYRRRRPMNGFSRPRKFKRAYARTRVPRNKLTDNTQYRFKRTIQMSSMASAVGSNAGSYSWSLSLLTNPTEFTSLFDSYKITGVSMRFMPRITEATGATGSNAFGTFMYVTDYDDQTVPTNQLEILERQSARLRQAANRPFKIFIRPKAGVALVPTSTFGQYAGWVDTANPTVLYYGLKWMWNNVVTPSTIDVYATIYMKFKGVK